MFRNRPYYQVLEGTVEHWKQSAMFGGGDMETYWITTPKEKKILGIELFIC